MKKTIFTGVGTAIITPMNEDTSINYEELGRVIEDQVNGGADSIVICGTTGESSTMTDEEHVECIKYAVKKVNGRIPVIAGAGSNDTAYAIFLSKEAKEAGADALLHVTPYYNKTSQKGLISHFTTIADSTDLPVILYNVPSRTGVNILPATCKALSEHPNIVAIKEASGNISQVAEMAALCGEDLDIYSGNDDQIVPLLSLGAKGVISVLSNVAPKPAHMICEHYFNGDVKKSLELQLKYLPLINALFSDVNPIPVKEAMNIIGYKAGKCRLPLEELSAEKREILISELKKMSVIG